MNDGAVPGLQGPPSDATTVMEVTKLGNKYLL